MLKAPCAAVFWMAAAMQAGAQQDPNPADMLGGAGQVLQLIDQSRLAEVWSGAAPGARKRVSAKDFETQVARARAPLGAAQRRSWVLISRQLMNDPDAELSGQYLSVEFETLFAARASAPVRELVSFQLGRDGVWRFSGYSIR